MDIKADVIKMLENPQLANLATITLEGKPWTRYVMIKADSAFTIRTAIFLESRKVDQIKNNPEVHLTFGINDPSDLNKPYVQIQGKASISEDPEAKKLYWFDALEMVFSGDDDPKYGLLEIEPYRVEFINPGSLKPEVWES